MIKSALEYLIGLGQVKTTEINGHTYSAERLNLVAYPTAAALEVSTLSGIVEYVLSDFDAHYFEGLLVHVLSPDKAELISNLYDDAQREVYMTAKAFKPGFSFGQYYELENFIIALQSCFVKTNVTAEILKLVGNLKSEAVKTHGDDGVTQVVTAKTGIATVENVAVPNPVILAPYRTFIEVEQPESKFVFRIKQGNNGPMCALFEADGGAWRLEAMASIKAYMEGQLAAAGVKVIS